MKLAATDGCHPFNDLFWMCSGSYFSRLEIGKSWSLSSSSIHICEACSYLCEFVNVYKTNVADFSFHLKHIPVNAEQVEKQCGHVSWR